MVNGSRLMAQWGPGAAVSHEPLTVSNRLINELFDDIWYVLGISKETIPCSQEDIDPICKILRIWWDESSCLFGPRLFQHFKINSKSTSFKVAKFALFENTKPRKPHKRKFNFRNTNNPGTHSFPNNHIVRLPTFQKLIFFEKTDCVFSLYDILLKLFLQ